MTHTISTNTFGGAALLVSPNAYTGNYTNINTAVAASSGQPVFVAPGTYSNNITLKNGVSIIGYSSDKNDVIVNNPLTTNDVTTVCYISGMYFYSNTASPIITLSGTAQKTITFNNCTFEAFNGPVASISASNASPSSITFNNCHFIISSSTASVYLFLMSNANVINFNNCTCDNAVNSPYQASAAGGTVNFSNSQIDVPIITSGTGAIQANFCHFDCQTATQFTINGNADCNFNHCFFDSGNEIAVTTGVSGVVTLSMCSTNSNTLSPFTGTGEILYDIITNNLYLSIVAPNAAVNTPLPLYFGEATGDSLVLTTPLTPGSGGTGINGSSATDGQLLIGNGTGYTLNTLTAGSGTTITNAAGAITIATSGGGVNVVNVTTATQAMAINTVYIINYGGGSAVLTLPATADLGDTIQITGQSVGWSIAQNANQRIYTAGGFTTIGVTGGIATTAPTNCITLRCVTAGANTRWNAEAFVGNLTVT